MLLASCLPQEKTTQCDSNEAYDSSVRKCVATLGTTGSLSISNISPTSSYTISYSDTNPTHSVTVSDPYNNGYQIRWNLTNPNGTSTLLGTGLSLTLAHTSYPSGTYILEAQLYNSTGAELIQSRSWSINIISEVVPTITAVTSSPFSTNITAAATTISTNISNPDAIADINYQWYVNGSAVAGESGQFSTTVEAISFNFDPTSASTYYNGQGIYTVQLILTEDGTGNIYTSEEWIITNNLPIFAAVTLDTVGATPTEGSIIDVLSGNTINDADPVGSGSSPAGGFYFDPTADADLDDAGQVNFCLSVDNITGIDGNGVFVDFLIDGANIPLATNLQFTTNNEIVCLSDLAATVARDFSYTIPATIVRESHTITAVVYDKYTGSTSQPTHNGYVQLDQFVWTIRVRQENTPPTLAIDDANTGAGSDDDGDGDTGTIDCTTKTTTAYSDCTIQQVADFNVAFTVTDDDWDPTLDEEDENFHVEFFLDGDELDGTANLSATNCEKTALAGVGDDSPAATRYICNISINAWDSNGPIDASTQSYTLTAQVTDVQSPYTTDDAISNTVTWQIATVNGYNTGIALNDFERAGAAPTTSTPETNASESYVSLAATPGVAVPLADGTPSGLSEGDLIQFHLVIDDPERDSFQIRIDRCFNADCSTINGGLGVQTVAINSTDDDQYKRITINHQISEDAVTSSLLADQGVAGDDAADIYYRIVVEDLGDPDAAVTDDNALDIYEDEFDDDAIRIITLDSVDNNNPDPVNNTALAPAYDPNQFNTPVFQTGTTPYVTFTGFPFTIDPGVFSDASLTDGDTILYQWVYNVDADDDGVFNAADWELIDGATDRVLIWSPGPEIDFNRQTGTNVLVKLCLGDDGVNNTGNDKVAFDAGGTNCFNPNLGTNFDGAAEDDDQAWNVTVFSNMAQGISYNQDTANLQAGGEIAVWIDPSTTNPVVKYMAYESSDGNLVIEKVVIQTDGTKGGSVETISEMSSIIMPATTANGTADFTDLSLVGDTDNSALYVSYVAPIPTGVGGSDVDVLQVRRIDISTGKTGFIHGGKFGFDIGYNDLSDNMNDLSGGGAVTVTNPDVNGDIVIVVTAAASTGTNIEFEFSGLNNPNNANATIQAGVGDFCPVIATCNTTALTATDLATAINNSTDPQLQGLTASVVGSTVTITGSRDNEFYEQDISANAIGKGIINYGPAAGGADNSWVLPYVDSSLSAADKNKLAIIFIATNVDLDLGTAMSKTDFRTVSDPADYIANDIDNDNNHVIALKVEGTGEINMYEIEDDNATIVERDTDLFSSTSITNLKVAMTKDGTNPSAFITGVDSSLNTGTLVYYRVDDDASNDYLAANSVVVNTLGTGFLPTSEMNTYPNYDISAGPLEHQLLVGVVHNNAGNINAYLLSVTGDASPALDCSYDSGDAQNEDKCAKILAQAANLNNIADQEIALGQTLDAVTIGDEGETANENIQDVMPYAFHVTSGGDTIPLVGLLNVVETDLTTEYIDTVNSVDPSPRANAEFILPYVAP